MKHLIISAACALLLIVNANAQLPVNSATKRVEFTNVVKVEKTSKEELAKRAKIWIASVLRSGSDIVTIDDENSKMIIGTGSLTLPHEAIGFMNNPVLTYTFTADCKDDRIKYTVNNMEVHYAIAAIRRDHATLYELASIKADMKESKKQKKIQEVNNVKAIIDAHIKDFIDYISTATDDNW
jgi:hypothetical protein